MAPTLDELNKKTLKNAYTKKSHTKGSGFVLGFRHSG